MPDKPLTIATYAAGASLAAITLVYVFAPTFFLDGESTSSSTGYQKKTIVGLFNPGNDCFINAILQALAGLGDLRVYLIRETHRRRMDGLSVYSQIVEDPERRELPKWKSEGLQLGIVTQGLKDILNALNERPICKKTISAGVFIKVLEEAFKQKISVQQQDAQEFFQVVAERLCDEYHAGQRVRNYTKITQSKINSDPVTDKISSQLKSETSLQEKDSILVKTGQIDLSVGKVSEVSDSPEDDECSPVSNEREEGFPFEGGSESQIECLTCGFKPKPTISTFCSLTLSLPQVSSTTLSYCFDQMFKTEYIEDFKCEKCRLVHARNIFEERLSNSSSQSLRLKCRKAIEVVDAAIENNREEELKNIEMPDLKLAPRRKIARYVRITNFPKVMAIHLSRSIFEAGHCTLKNSAKVVFPEIFSLGGLLNRKLYRLSSVVCHKGSHNSGHYESFRRHTLSAPFSTPDTFKPAKIYSRTGIISPSLVLKPWTEVTGSSKSSIIDHNTSSSVPKNLCKISTSSSSISCGEQEFSSGQGSSNGTTRTSITSKTGEKKETKNLRSRARFTLSKVSGLALKKTESSENVKEFGRTRPARGKKENGDRWWRISDDKIKECKTADVLAMQREVYLLFYELEKEK